MPLRRSRSATDWLYILRDGAMAVAAMVGFVVVAVVSIPQLLGDLLVGLFLPHKDDRR